MSRLPASSSPIEGGEDWLPIPIGQPVVSFAPRPPGTQPYLPDTICDAWATEHFTVRLAAVRGYAHRYERMPRQDDAAVVEHPGTGIVVFAVADGVSQARQAHVGSTLACAAAITAMLSALDTDAEHIDWYQVVHAVAQRLVAHAQSVLGLAGPDPVRAEELLATTLVVGVLRPPRDGHDAAHATMVQVGDTSAWLLRDGSFQEAFSTGSDARYLITAEVFPLPRVPDRVLAQDVALPPDGVLLVGTDGFGGPLGDGSGLVGQMFANVLAAPPTGLKLAYTLDFSRETFDDDRALVAIWPIPEPDNAREQP
jgi:Protein phosphatase 2C